MNILNTPSILNGVIHSATRRYSAVRDFCFYPSTFQADHIGSGNPDIHIFANTPIHTYINAFKPEERRCSRG